ncbi:hypothetical protein BXZ70DRAFT_1025894 [Cristinia sonorae]|uniref:VHS domain-containing protein n=1 Tax=Cristinia sonorae TaxID=1940300 RepID=A0A8K0XPC0_9AGAR|nr:hypothetical protein BXZ70DRAFT_1025894 [Cristinia sonorae]
MKRLFGREKQKLAKTPSTASDLISDDGHYYNDHAQHQQPHRTYERSHNQDRMHAHPPPPSDDHWDLEASPVPQPYVPRAVSPFSGAVSVTSARSVETTRKKQPPPATAAIGILRSLDPHHSHLTASPPVSIPREPSPEEILRPTERVPEKKKPGFWERAKERDKEKERLKEEEKKDRQGLRSKDKSREEDSQAELTRMIGYLTANASEDWSLVLEVCERASASEAAARETVKALRREFKYAEPTAQLAAARLWAVLLQNSSGLFMVACQSRKFLETLEDIILFSRTPPVFRDRLMQVLAAAAYASPGPKDPFRVLWRRLKQPNQPDEGIPLDPDDAMLNPPVPTPAPAAEQPRTRTPSHQRPPNKHKASSRIIPPEEDMRRLFEECKYAHGNAALLSDALIHARPEDLQGKAIIKEFYARCRASQELIYAQVPWATANAERSRHGAGAPRQKRRNSPPDSPMVDVDETVEEQLLGALLSANEQLTEALKMFEDLERVKKEKDVEERSKKETRANYRVRSRHHNNDSDGSIPQSINSHSHAHAFQPPISPSPSPSPSPPPSVTVTPYTPTQPHPLPPIPNSGYPNQINAQQQLAARALQQQQSQQTINLSFPPPAPHGPRLPLPPHRSGGSPSPSPTDRSFVTGPPSIRAMEMSSPEWDRFADGQSHRQGAQTPRGKHPYENILEMEDDSGSGGIDGGEENYEAVTPHQPSAKALGKRRVVDPEDQDGQFDPDDMFYENTNESRNSPSGDDLDSDNDGPGGLHSHQRRPVRYVYDAAAEKTRERIREGRLHLAAENATTLVGGVH